LAQSSEAHSPKEIDSYERKRSAGSEKTATSGRVAWQTGQTLPTWPGLVDFPQSPVDPLITVVPVVRVARKYACAATLSTWIRRIRRYGATEMRS